MRKPQSLLFALLGLFIMLSAPAKAQDPELYFYPAQKWQIAKSMPMDANDGPDVCTIMATYNNGFILSFSGQQSGINRLHVDFRQPVFQPGGSYNTEINVPGGFNRTIPATADQDNMITVDIKDTAPFYNAIKQIGVLDLEIEQNKFRFYLTGINASSSNFESCMGGESATAAVVNDEPSELSEPPPVDMAEMKTPPKKPEISAEAKRPQPPAQAKMSEQLAAQMDKVDQKKSVSLNDEIVWSEPQPQPAKPSLLKPAEEPATVPAPNARGPRTARAVNTAPPATAPVKRPDLQHSEEVARQTPKTVSYKTPPIKTTKEAVKTAEIDFTDIEEPAPKPPATKPLPVKEVPVVRAVPPGKSENVTPTAVPRSYNTAEMTKLRAENERLREQNAVLDKRLAASITRENEQKASISSDNWDLERATLRYNEAERQLEKVGQKLQRLRAQCDQEKRSLENMLFDPAVTSQQQLAKLANLEDEIQRLKQDMALQRRRYEEQIRLLQQQMMQMR